MRVGIGLAAGLLVGLAIITAAGGLGSTGLVPDFGTFAAVQASTSTITTSTQSTMTGSIQSFTTTAPYPTGSGNGTQVVTSTASVTGGPAVSTSTSTASSTPPTAALSPAYNQVMVPSSRFSSIAQQPVYSNVILVIPLLVAFLLGALIYQRSIRGKNALAEDRETSEG